MGLLVVVFNLVQNLLLLVLLRSRNAFHGLLLLFPTKQLLLSLNHELPLALLVGLRHGLVALLGFGLDAVDSLMGDLLHVVPYLNRMLFLLGQLLAFYFKRVLLLPHEFDLSLLCQALLGQDLFLALLGVHRVLLEHLLHFKRLSHRPSGHFLSLLLTSLFEH